MNKNLKARWDHIGEKIMEKNNKLPDRFADKIDAIISGEEQLSVSPIQNNTITTQSVQITSPEENEVQYLPACKKTYIPTPNVVFCLGLLKRELENMKKMF